MRIIHEIRGLLLLLSTLVMSAVFLLTKTGNYKTFYPYFPFNQDVVLTRDTYVYFLFERLIMVVMSLFIYVESSKFRTALKVFVFIQVFDAIDYVLTYNKTWVLEGFLISWDVLKVALFSLAIAHEVLQMVERKLQNE
jgi:hypothetical protein